MLAAEVAPHADRLVWAVAREMRKQVDSFQPRWEAAGVPWEAFGVLKQLAPWLRQHGMTDEIVTRRFRYDDLNRIRGVLESLSASGHVILGSARYRSTAKLGPAFAALDDVLDTATADLWGGHTDAVATATDLIVPILEATPSRFVMTATFRDLPEPEAPGAKLHNRLIGLRYLRNEAHAEAWAERRMTAQQMVLLTSLWQGEGGDVDTTVEDELWRKRLLAGGALTREGRSIRDAIEARTNELAEPAFAQLDGSQGDELVGALGSLPG